jgi:AICAR transformylase/IMP cyclohydrolase PurH
MFYEIVVAPGYTLEGLEVLKGKSKALRILEAKPRGPSGRSLRQVAGGWLLQVGGRGCAVVAVGVGSSGGCAEAGAACC